MKLSDLLEPIQGLADTLFDLVIPEPVKVDENKDEGNKQETRDSDEYERVEYFRKRKSKPSSGAKETGKTPRKPEQDDSSEPDGSRDSEPGSE